LPGLLTFIQPFFLARSLLFLAFNFALYRAVLFFFIINSTNISIQDNTYIRFVAIWLIHFMHWRIELRRAGILLHPSSLNTNGPCGDFGEAAYQFLDWLQEAGIQLWQTLPLHPPGGGFSPYSSPSAFAGAAYLISLDTLVSQDLLSHSEIADRTYTHRMDQERIITWKLPLIEKAAKRYVKRDPDIATKFARENHWANDWALFESLRKAYSVDGWQQFPTKLQNRHHATVKKAQTEHAEQIQIELAIQHIFFQQWNAIRTAAKERNILIVGDMPIFISADGVDSWVNRKLFKWGDNNQPSPMSGAPPDIFSPLGQHWGNPLYNWPEHKKTNFEWWIKRLAGELCLTDYIRIDHFRGFCEAWEIPRSADGDARQGSWGPALGDELFQTFLDNFGELPFVAEDLGVITPDVDELREKYALMGMKVLQFAFDKYTNEYLPHNYSHSNWACYTGTHDNDTSRGWYQHSDETTKHRFRVYVGRDGSDASWDMIRLAWSSNAKWAIAPLQDILNLGSEGRMNIPGQSGGHWGWRMFDIPMYQTNRLRDLTEAYGRLHEQQAPQ
jgi:4-alpha-glucanotransferase